MISAPLTTAASVIISGFAVPALTQTGLRKLHEKPYPATVIALLGVLGAGLGATAALSAFCSLVPVVDVYWVTRV